jgi:hypothetical protein
MFSSNENDWLKKFYDGSLLVKGWKQRTAEILKAISPAEQETARARLDGLGKKIGREWSKDNDVRQIDTSMLQTWGEALQNAKNAGHETLLVQIDTIESEVDSILS